MGPLEGIALSGDWPEPVGTYEGELLIVGGGRCVWEDLERLGPVDYDIMCVNEVGLRFPGRIEHWFTNHGEQFPYLISLRNMGQTGRTWGPKYTHTMMDCPHSQKADFVWPLPIRGNSGLGAILVGLALGYRKIHVAGVPLDDSGHFYDPPEGHWLQEGAKGLSAKVKWSNFARHYDKILENDTKQAYKGRVTFLSRQKVGA